MTLSAAIFPNPDPIAPPTTPPTIPPTAAPTGPPTQAPIAAPAWARRKAANFTDRFDETNGLARIHDKLSRELTGICVSFRL